jgi:hypothetical protein
MSFIDEIKKRRTFGVIAHPDAGKTTLTEKLLLFGGAIQEAGAVKSNKIKKGATSDFMEIERQRGISVATSSYNQKTVSSGQSIPKTGAAAGGVHLLNETLVTIKNYKVGLEHIKLLEQIKTYDIKNPSVFDRAYNDMAEALDRGLLKGFSISEIDQIFNYVLYGGDRGQSQEVINMGKFIIQNFSDAGAQFRLMTREFEQDRLQQSNEEYQTSQEKD